MDYLKNKYIYLILIIFFLVNLLFLTSFPFVHSDEAWLAGLSRTIITEKTFNITEPFFDLYPRTPHAIKIIFNTIQILFMSIFGYNIFTFRLISLIFATTGLYFFYLIALYFTKSKLLASLISLLLAVDIQFIYASHFARQEIVLVTLLLASFYYFLTYILNNYSIKNNVILGLIISFSIGIHPNSFIIFLPFFFLYLYSILFIKKIKFFDLLIFITTVTGFTLFFIGLSIYFDPNFISNYLGYGETLGVLSSISIKIERLIYFYRKLFYQVSGTYFTPNIKIQFILFTSVLIYSLFIYFSKKNYINDILITTLFSINLGYILIGRYNQTSIIFIFPLFYLLLVYLLKNIKIEVSKVVLILLIVLISTNSIYVIVNNTHFNYDNYLNEISSVVSKDDRVLANLNTQFYFDYNKLFDYRNLAHLKRHDFSFKEYIEKNNIQYIIYPEEMDFIYKYRPKWNLLYGNVYSYYHEMKEFFNEECTVVFSFTNKTYPMRIARFVGEDDWKVVIYKVK